METKETVTLCRDGNHTHLLKVGDGLDPFPRIFEADGFDDAAGADSEFGAVLRQRAVHVFRSWRCRNRMQNLEKHGFSGVVSANAGGCVLPTDLRAMILEVFASSGTHLSVHLTEQVLANYKVELVALYTETEAQARRAAAASEDGSALLGDGGAPSGEETRAALLTLSDEDVFVDMVSLVAARQMRGLQLQTQRAQTQEQQSREELTNTSKPTEGQKHIHTEDLVMTRRYALHQHRSLLRSVFNRYADDAAKVTAREVAAVLLELGFDDALKDSFDDALKTAWSETQSRFSSFPAFFDFQQLVVLVNALQGSGARCDDPQPRVPVAPSQPKRKIQMGGTFRAAPLAVRKLEDV